MRKVKAIFLSALIIMTLCIYDASAKSEQTFSDVTPTHWAYSYIEQAVEKGYVDGVGGGKYDPDGSISNAQFVAMLVKAFMSDALSQDNSSRSKWTQWWGPYIQVALDRGLLNGMTLYDAFDYTGANGLAAIADLPISRFDMAEAILSMIAHLHIEEPSSASITRARASIADYGSMPTAHRVAVDFAYASGCLTGIDSKGTFAGSTGMTRAQAAVVLIRLDELKETGTISGSTNSPSAPSYPSDITQGYWLLYDPNPDRMEIYCFRSDGTFEYRIPGSVLSRGSYELRNKSIIMHYPDSGSDREYTYDSTIQGWTRDTTRRGDVKWTEMLFNCSTCNDFFMAPEWIQQSTDSTGKNCEVVLCPNTYKSIEDVDFVPNPYFNPKYTVYQFYEIRTNPGSSLICSFALPVSKYINYSDEISIIFQSDEYFIINIWHGPDESTMLSYSKKSNSLKMLPNHEFTYPVNSSLLLGYDFVADASFPNSMVLYTMVGEHVCNLITDKYSLTHAITDTHIYYAYSETAPDGYNQHLHKIWRYDLTTGEQEEVYSLVCREIEELGPGYIKYKESWTGPTLTVVY